MGIFYMYVCMYVWVKFFIESNLKTYFSSIVNKVRGDVEKGDAFNFFYL